MKKFFIIFSYLFIGVTVSIFFAKDRNFEMDLKELKRQFPEQPYLTGAKGEIRYYYQKGNKPTLVLLTGLNGSLDSFLNLVSLYPDREILSFDFYGQGFSESSTMLDYTIEDFRAQLEEVLIAFKVKSPFDVYASSLGAVVLESYALKNPSAINRVVLFSPLGFNELPLFEKMIGSRFFGPILKFYISEHVYVRNFHKYFRKIWEFLDEPERIFFIRDTYPLILKVVGFKEAFHKIRRNNNFEDIKYLTLSPKVQKVFWGEFDPINPYPGDEKLKNIFPNATFHLLKEAGHFPYHEKANEAKKIIDL